jgi:hypothetical protein
VKAGLIAIAMLLAAPPSHAQSIDDSSGDFFVPICKDAFSPNRPESPLDTYGYGECVGIFDTLIALGPYLERPRHFCPPGNAQAIDAFRVSALYLQGRPHLLHQKFTQTVIAALTQAWPCN